MRRVIAWFGVATLCVLTSSAQAQNDVLKPYVVLILDTSGSMDDATGSGPTSCGKADKKINHAVCAINNIVNSYGDMVFGLARFAETTGGSATSCPTNCTTQGPYCGDCTASTDTSTPCTFNSDCTSNDCDTVAGHCREGNGGCTSNDKVFQLLSALVDGGNSTAAKFTDGACNTCGIGSTGTSDPEIWGVNPFTFTPLAAVLKGDKRYWQGLQSSDGTTTIWNTAFAGYDPINRDPQSAVFLQKTTAVPTTCNSDHASCDATISCTGANCCCDTCNPNPSTCDNTAGCKGGNCCCATQCRPYVTILLTDGDETCASFTSDTTPAAAALQTTQPHADTVNISAVANQGVNRSSNVVTLTTATAHPFAVGNSFVVSGVADASFNSAPNTTFKVKSVLNATQITYDQVGTNVASQGGTVRHAASDYQYRIDMKPIGFGKPPGDTQIEALAHAGGAADLPGVNEGYYASNEADLELAISTILADSVRSESCNGRDDDCDTRVDEDFPNKGSACQAVWAQSPPAAVGLPAGDPRIGQVAVGECATTGTTICSTDGTGTTCTAVPNPVGVEGPGCDGKDNDCDGRIDEGLSCQSCVPTGETCDGTDQDCDTVPDQTCRCSGNNSVKCNGTDAACTAASAGTCVCVGITQGCSITNSNGTCPGTKTCSGGSFGTCVGTTPAAEVCNGKDDDCDGVCDGFQATCSEVVSACVATNASSCPASDNPGDPSHGPILHSEASGFGNLKCLNNTDDDGDGAVNDGCPAVGAAETGAQCSNATDDDNDGRINDGCPTVATALISQNICHAGSRSCNVPPSCPASSNQFNGCTGELKPAATDGCDGFDNDCDNAIDEDFQPADCSTNCGVGTTQCINGQVSCNSVPAGTDNTCNNVDDDCDNKIDEDWVCNPAVGCTGPDCCVCGTGTTCEKNQCINGVRTCVTSPPINPETCNCLDDNCNGQTDEGQLCPSGAQCTNCQCAFPCAAGEFPCPIGKKCDHSSQSTTTCTLDTQCPQGETCVTGHCTQGFCVNDPCYSVTCPPVNGHMQTCIQNPDPAHANEAQCVDSCSLKTCGAGQVCVDSVGDCRPDDCVTFPSKCTASQSCVKHDGLGVCVTNTCQGVTCESGKYCVGGTCVSSCSDVTCATGQRCVEGMCETDPCGHPCPFGQACNDNTGKCIEDPCKVRDCGADSGQWCNPNSGQCEDDPCIVNHITCPNPGEVCRGGTCLDPDTLGPDAAGEAHVTVGGGGGCSTTGNSSSTGILLALALLVSRRRRASSAKRRKGGAA